MMQAAASILTYVMQAAASILSYVMQHVLADNAVFHFCRHDNADDMPSLAYNHVLTSILSFYIGRESQCILQKQVDIRLASTRMTSARMLVPGKTETTYLNIKSRLKC